MHAHIMKQEKLNRPEKYNSIEWFLFEEAQLRICINDETDIFQYPGLFTYLQFLFTISRFIFF